MSTSFSSIARDKGSTESHRVMEPGQYIEHESAALETHDNMHTQSVRRGLRVQAKLEISQPQDADELEADQTAEQVMRMPDSAIGMDNLSISRAGKVQRACEPCEEEQHIQRSASGATSGKPASAGFQVPSRHAGQALPPSTRQFFEPRFGQDFSHVRIHADSTAADSAHAISARAYTHEDQIVFGAGHYSPETESGKKLLAHELTHVVQQGRSRKSDRIARQNAPIVNPVLSQEEMFGIITRERAWSFSPGGGTLTCDPAGVGRGVGPAAGGRMAGHSVFAVIQVTDADSRPVALSYGEHISYSDPHAEQRAVAALSREIPRMRDVSGGRMMVVLDQVPCPPGRSDCMGLLQRFANERGLALEIHLPERERMSGGGTVAPRTAAMSSMRTDVPPVTLRRYYPGGTAPPAPPVSGVGVTGTGPAISGTAPLRLTPPTAASAATIRAQASLIIELENETARSVRLTARINLITRGITGLLAILGMIGTIRTFQSMASEGTLFGDAERQVDRVNDYAVEMENWAMDTTDNISILAAMSAITDAVNRDDSEALFDLDDSFYSLSTKLLERADQFSNFARDLRARQQALNVLADAYATMVSIPQGATTAPNAEELAMHISCQRLAGSMGNPAGHFETAERQLRFYGDYFNSLSNECNSRGWSIIGTRISVAMAEIDRGRSLDERLRRERRLNQIQVELESIEAELNQPVCRPDNETDWITQQRDMLIFERDQIRSQQGAT